MVSTLKNEKWKKTRFLKQAIIKKKLCAILQRELKMTFFTRKLKEHGPLGHHQRYYLYHVSGT